MSSLSREQFHAHVKAYTDQHPDLADPEYAIGRCVDESDELAWHLRERGVQTRSVTVPAHRRDSPEVGRTLFHTALMAKTHDAGWQVADPTYAQVDYGSHPVPYVGDPKKWRDTVRDIRDEVRHYP